MVTINELFATHLLSTHWKKFVYASQKTYTPPPFLLAHALNSVDYYSGNYWVILPVMQKIDLLITIIWVLSLQYFTTNKDFQALKG